MSKPELDEVAKKFWSKLHDLAGRCGHCGKAKCPERKNWSNMPDRIKFEDLRRAAEHAGIDL